MKEFVRLNASNLPIEKRVDIATIEKILSTELKNHHIDTKFGFSIFDKNHKITKKVTDTYK